MKIHASEIPETKTKSLVHRLPGPMHSIPPPQQVEEKEKHPRRILTCYTIALTCPDKSSIALIALIVRAMPQLCVLLILIHNTSCWFFCLPPIDLWTHPSIQRKRKAPLEDSHS